MTCSRCGGPVFDLADCITELCDYSGDHDHIRCVTCGSEWIEMYDQENDEENE